MSRLPAHAPGSLSAERQAVYDAIAGGKRASSSLGLVKADGSLAGPFNAWVHAPTSAPASRPSASRCASISACRSASPSSPSCAWPRSSPPSSSGTPTPGWPPRPASRPTSSKRSAPATARRCDELDLVVFALAVELLGPGHRVPEVLYERAVTLLGVDQVVELVNLIGYYCLVSCVLNAFDVALPDGVRPPFEEPDPPIVPTGDDGSGS
ncbi:MAG: hypothetical protein R2755_10485 [Acidimicrobiales bacterium]